MELLRRVLESSPTGFALVEKDGTFRYVNKALIKILQYSFEELTQITWQELTHHDDLLVDLALVKEVLKGVRQNYRLEKRYIRRDGSICYALLSVATVLNDDGEMDCFCSQIIDTTQYVELERKVNDAIAIKHQITAFQNEVLEAIAANEFVLHYQEIVNLKTLEAIGYEALIRWQHPTKGLLYPDKFIEICERNPDVMLQLCQWVFKQGVSDRKKLNGFVSLNISPQSLLHLSFLDMASKHCVLGDRPVVFLEITERVLANLEESKVLKSLECDGYGFFVDDFGQANSGLVQVIQIINSLKFNSSVKIKIDIWFTRHIHEPITYASMKVLLNLFKGMGVEAIAEGIETEAQLKTWQELGCEYGQGWLWGKPKAID